METPRKPKQTRKRSGGGATVAAVAQSNAKHAARRAQAAREAGEPEVETKAMHAGTYRNRALKTST